RPQQPIDSEAEAEEVAHHQPEEQGEHRPNEHPDRSVPQDLPDQRIGEKLLIRREADEFASARQKARIREAEAYYLANRIEDEGEDEKHRRKNQGIPEQILLADSHAVSLRGPRRRPMGR